MKWRSKRARLTIYATGLIYLIGAAVLIGGLLQGLKPDLFRVWPALRDMDTYGLLMAVAVYFGLVAFSHFAWLHSRRERPERYNPPLQADEGHERSEIA